MHKRTIDAYDRDADHWAKTRTADPTRPAWTMIHEFRAQIGAGLVLDLGCGPGHMFAALGPPLLGLDASSNMLALARRAHPDPLIRADIETLPFRAASARGALGNFSFQHLPRDGFRRAVAEASRVLVAGGPLQLAVHAGDYEGDDRPGDDVPGRWFSYWEEQPLVAQLEEASFDVLGVHRGPTSLRVTARRLA